MSAGQPLALNDPNAVWYVEDGELDVFLVESDDDGAASSRLSYLLRTEAGRLIFGVEADGGSLTLIAKSLPGSRILRLDSDWLRQCIPFETLTEQVDAWIIDFAATIADGIDPRPRADVLVHTDQYRHRSDSDVVPARSDDVVSAPPDSDAVSARPSSGVVSTPPGSVVSARVGSVVWVRGCDAADYLETEEIDSTALGMVPLTSDTWVTLRDEADLSGVSSRSLSAEQLLEGLGEFHRMALSAESLNRVLRMVDTANQQVARVSHHHSEREAARESLFSVLGPSGSAPPERGSPLALALHEVGRHEGIQFRLPRSLTMQSSDPSAAPPPLQDVLQESGVRYRRVRLRSGDRWWRGDSGAMLAFRRDDGAPSALLPSVFGSYREFDPVSGTRRRVNAHRAQDIDEKAWSFYRSYHPDGKFGVRRLIGFGLRRMRPIAVIVAISGFLVSLQSLAPAFMSGMLTGRLLPPVADGTISLFVVVLSGVAVLSTALLMLQGLLMVRAEGRFIARTASGIVDRLLNLPLGFFREFRAGDLMIRVLGLWTMRDQISGIFTHVILVVIFLLPALGLLFLYDTVLAFTSLVMGLLMLGATTVVAMMQTTPQRDRLTHTREMMGRLHQHIGGMSKLRSTGAEDSAFASLTRCYRRQLIASRRVSIIDQHLVALSASAPALGCAALFIVTLNRGTGSVEVADFLVVYIVSAVFFGSVANFGRAFYPISSVLPVLEQVMPILRARPSRGSQEASLGAGQVQLQGHMSLDDVSFRYNEGDPLTLNGVSIEVNPGEFVAIVGNSGAGKSTLLRLALGLEEPTSGAVYYDGKDLANLSAHSVRRQIGVVSQDVAMQPGNILQNIVGLNDDLTIDDAWHAARLADVADDIKAMSMQMFTPTGDSAAAFSGGQMQRIRIAAALVRNPRIVYLDEATSWLDANTQNRVMKGIESLSASRIVIAHRMSTIMHADRIYVLSAGRVVQHGTFDELCAVKGTFRQLMERQIV